MLGLICSSLKKQPRISIESEKSTKQLFNRNHQLRRRGSGGDTCIFGITTLSLRRRSLRIQRELRLSLIGL